jgi:ribosomal protein S18 acetylase RimI-like enzyme
LIQFQHNAAGISADHLVGFFAGWPSPPTPQCHLRILQQSSRCVVARDDASGRVVGFITALTDGILCASISLLEVVPQYQHQGIGNQLVRRMLKDLGPLYAIDLTCDPALAEFYQRFDFTPWHGMIQRNYQQQSGCCESQGETT